MGELILKPNYKELPLIFTIDVSMDGNSYQIPHLSGAYSYDYDVDWGDGSVGHVTSWDDPETIHVYDASGTYSIKVKGVCDVFYNYNSLNLKKVNSLGNIPFERLYFYNCDNLETITSRKNANTENITSFESLFYGCNSLTDLDLSGSDMSNVTNLRYFARQASLLKNANLSGCDFSSCDNMGLMFFQNSLLEFVDMSGFVSESIVTSASSLFFYCYKLREIKGVENWKMPMLVDSNSMFSYCTSLGSLDLSNWDTRSLSIAYNMFSGSSNLTSVGDLSNWDTSSLSNVSNMFYNCKSLTSIGDVSNWDTHSLTNISNMFYSCWNLELPDISGWDVSNVTSFGSLFLGCKQLETLDLSTWNTSSLSGTLQYLFSGCPSLNYVNLSGWDTSKVTSVRGISNALNVSLKTVDFSGWDLPLCTDISWMFDGNTNLETLDMSGFVSISQAVTANRTFRGCINLQEIKGVENWRLPFVVNADDMFSDCRSLKSMDLSDWDTSALSTARNMFYRCWELTSIGDLSNWDTHSLSNTGSMFREIKNIISIGDVSSWNTSKITTTASMFQSCSSLGSINLSNWDTSTLTNTSAMFNNCTSLTSVGDLSNWDTHSLINISNMFKTCPSLNLVGVNNWNVENLTTATNFAYNCTFDPSEYDLILENWSAQSVNSGLSIDFGYTKYSNDASIYKKVLTDTYGWTIYDGGIL